MKFLKRRESDIVKFSAIIVFILVSQSFALAQTCTLRMQDVNFGNVNVLPGSAIDITASLQINCSGFLNTGGRTCINIGAGSSGDAVSRIFTGPSTLRFDLYTTAARTTIWGSWVTGYKSPGIQLDVDNGSHLVTVYGRLLGSQQTASVGNYVSNFVAQPLVTYRNQAASTNCPTSSSSETSTSFNALATVVAACTVSTGSMSFGSVGLLNSNLDATATVSPHCTNGAPYSVSLSNGNTGTGPTARIMVNGGNTVIYGLYRDASRSLPWGSTIGTNTVSSTGTGIAQPITVYGRVPSQSTPPPGSYTDTVIVTVTY